MLGAFVVAGLLAGGSVSVSAEEACRCGAAATFEEAIQDAPVVVIGRVARQVALGEGRPTWLVIGVKKSLKGGGAEERVVRVRTADSSPCALDLSLYRTDSLVALALHPVPEADRSFWDRLQWHAEYEVQGCGRQDRAVAYAEVGRVEAEIRLALATP
jgi:hypothetical protein